MSLQVTFKGFINHLMPPDSSGCCTLLHTQTLVTPQLNSYTNVSVNIQSQLRYVKYLESFLLRAVFLCLKKEIIELSRNYMVNN